MRGTILPDIPILGQSEWNFSNETSRAFSKSSCGVAAVPGVVSALRGLEAIEEFSDPTPESMDGSLLGFTEQSLQHGEDLLDGIEVGAVGSQEHQRGAEGFDAS